MKNNKHTKSVPADKMQLAKQAVDQAISIIREYALALTPEERHKMLKMGTNRFLFVEKSHNLASQNASLRPSYLDMATFDADFADAHNLWTLQTAVRELDALLTDTAMAAGSEAFQESLLFYNAVKMAAAQDILGARSVYEDLRKVFPVGRRKTHSSQ